MKKERGHPFYVLNDEGLWYWKSEKQQGGKGEKTIICFSLLEKFLTVLNFILYNFISCRHESLKRVIKLNPYGSFIWHSQNDKITEMENRLVVARGWGGRRVGDRKGEWEGDRFYGGPASDGGGSHTYLHTPSYNPHTHKPTHCFPSQGVTQSSFKQQASVSIFQVGN